MEGWDSANIVRLCEELHNWFEAKGLSQVEQGSLLGIAVVRLALTASKPMATAQAICTTVMIGVETGVKRGIVPPEAMRKPP